MRKSKKTSRARGDYESPEDTRGQSGSNNEHLFRNVTVPLPMKQLYISNGQIVACLDANGEPWEFKRGVSAGAKYWNKITVRGRRRKTRAEVEDDSEDD